MKSLKHLMAKGTASQLIWVSFSMPDLLMNRSFVRLMHRVFSRLAPSYDRLGRRLAAEEVVLGPLSAATRALPDVPLRALDLACGTGLATFLLRRVFPEAMIVGADISEQMIKQMRRKPQDLKTGDLHGLVCNSGQLPFGVDRFDLVMTQNAPPYLEEMVRVLHPGGKLVLTYSFVFTSSVQAVIERRLKSLDLSGVTFLKAEEGMAVIAEKSHGREQP